MEKSGSEKIFISIITITKNDPGGMLRTFSSLSSQNLAFVNRSSVEWVIVNGGVPEDLPDIPENPMFCSKITINSSSDRGIFDAMNKGLRFAKGEHVLFLNSGDVLYSSITLSILLEWARIYSDRIIAGNVEIRWKGIAYICDLSPWVCHQATLTPRYLLEDYKFDITKRFYGDLHLWMRLKRDYLFRLERVNHVVCIFELGGIGNKPEYLLERFLERLELTREFGNKFFPVIQCFRMSAAWIIWRVFGRNAYYRVDFISLRLGAFLRRYRRLNADSR